MIEQLHCARSTAYSSMARSTDAGVAVGHFGRLPRLAAELVAQGQLRGVLWCVFCVVVAWHSLVLPPVYMLACARARCTRVVSEGVVAGALPLPRAR